MDSLHIKKYNKLNIILEISKPMIQYINGNLFTSNAKVLVNTVNTVGVMGKGIAADFKKYYPDMFSEYKRRCLNNELNIGDLFLYKTSNKWILNFPTKKHWRSPSKIEYIEAGLKKLVEEASNLQITDIAMPKLGCGNGGLDWETEVKPIVEKYLKKSPINVSIYEFDKDITPEHLKPKEIEDWLLSDPENLTFKLFYEDILNLYGKKNLFEDTTILNDDGYHLHYDNSNLMFTIEKKDFKLNLSKDDIKTMFFTLHNLGKLDKDDIYHDLYQYHDIIFDFFSKPNYILRDKDKVILNYTKKAQNIEVETLNEL